MARNTRSAAWMIGVAAAIAGGAVHAGPENVRFPVGWEKWERYGTVDRHDTRQYRELFAPAEVVKAVRAGLPIPDGAVLVMAIHAARVDGQGAPVRGADGRFVSDKLAAVTVMEKRKGWGADYPAEWRNGEWEYASFFPDGRPNEKANATIRNCFVCHKPHAKQDYVISLAKLAGTFPTAAATGRSGPLDVNITNFLFGPLRLIAEVGRAITWTNTDDSPHQITVTGKNELRTAVLLKGQSASLTFREPGVYPYICGLHPNMKGEIEVK